MAQKIGIRITPACAGKSGQLEVSKDGKEDHPRVCGEKLRRLALTTNRPGSPPRVRGKAQESIDAEARLRITPACAGKSRGADKRDPTNQDHPRVCGEKPLLALGKERL